MLKGQKEHLNRSSASPEQLQLQMQLMQHNLHLDTMRVLTDVLKSAQPTSPLYLKTESTLLHLIEPFLPPAPPCLDCETPTSKFIVNE